MQVLHHKLKFVEKGTLSDKMFDIFDDLQHQEVEFILRVQTQRVGNILIFVGEEELPLPLEADHLEVLLQCDRFVHVIVNNIVSQTTKHV